MAFNIQRTRRVQGTEITAYFVSKLKWTTKFDERKVFSTQSSATRALNQEDCPGGVVVSE
jgi:hypothetical protein